MANLADEYEMPDVDTSAQDKRLVVRFSVETRPDSAKTEQTGEMHFREIDFIRILIPGDKTLNVFRPVQPADKQRFPLQYQAFKNKQGEVLVGTPLSAWAAVTDSQRRELDFFNIRTVEQLADVADNFASNMMGVQALKQQAQKYLSISKEAAPTVKLMKEIEKKDGEISALQGQITELAKRFEELAKPKK